MSAEGQAIINENGYVGSSDAAAYAANGASGKLVVGGSSSVSPVMVKLIEAYKAVNANADIELLTSDSTTGMTSAIEGTYDIGMASRELKEDEGGGAGASGHRDGRHRRDRQSGKPDGGYDRRADRFHLPRRYDEVE